MNILTTTQSAQLLRVHPDHVKRLLSAENVKPLGKIGRTWAWDRERAQRVAARRMIRKFRS